MRLRLQLLFLFSSFHLLPRATTDGDTMTLCSDDVCEYDFVISRRQTMTYVHSNGVLFNVVLNGSRLVVVENSLRLTSSYPGIVGMTVDPSNVITADGYPRDVIVINNQFPGPTIEVMEGAKVVVHVHNHLLSEVTSIHWHGMHQKKNFFMDGVPYITQCPILPRQTFTYVFEAEPIGTHWYHSHHVNQRLDGLYGMIIVHTRLDIPSSQNLFVTDWYHVSHEAVAIRSGYWPQPPGTGFTGENLRHSSRRDFSVDGVELTTMSYVSSLLGGRGRLSFSSEENDRLPLRSYSLRYGRKERFRLVHSGAEFSYEILADGHLLTVVSLDGHGVQPMTFDSIIIHPGESIDFEIFANQTPSRYWLRARTLLDGNDPELIKNDVVQEVRAILDYKEYKTFSDENENVAIDTGDEDDDGGYSSDIDDPVSRLRFCSESQPCVIFNCPFSHYPVAYNKTCKHVYQAESSYDGLWLASNFGLKDDEVKEIFLNFAFIGGSSVNGRRFIHPRRLSINDSDITPCNDELCRRNGCSCTSILQLPVNQTVQFVLMNYQPRFDPQNLQAHHSVHLHGHSFTVLATGFSQRTTSAEGRQAVMPNSDITCDNDICSVPRWTNANRPNLRVANPSVKSTVLVPAQGYVIVRLRTDNPGRWFMHCHQELHAMKGMALIVNEAEEQQPVFPVDFPSCNEFKMAADDDGKKNDKEHLITISSEPEQSTVDADKTANECTNISKGLNGDVLLISTRTAIGAAFGFTLFGAILATIPFLLKIFFCSKSPKKIQIKQDNATELLMT